MPRVTLLYTNVDSEQSGDRHEKPQQEIEPWQVVGVVHLKATGRR